MTRWRNAVERAVEIAMKKTTEMGMAKSQATDSPRRTRTKLPPLLIDAGGLSSVGEFTPDPNEEYFANFPSLQQKRKKIRKTKKREQLETPSEKNTPGNHDWSKAPVWPRVNMPKRRDDRTPHNDNVSQKRGPPIRRQGNAKDNNQRDLTGVLQKKKKPPHYDYTK
jgi:hypothetical protein